ncbi:30S ribosomal protein S4 [Candidatus Pacearchaeota archaeon]|nr:30S ribosomal protein S4 [Candidatus Pacearchaeota archaeon]
MIRKKKNYVKPKQIFEAGRIEEENVLKEKYGLKNKREIWKTLAIVNYFRRRAKELARAPLEEQEVFFSKLRAIGLNINSVVDVLDLKVENILDRRLSTIVASKGVANTTRQARQMVVHKKILVNGKVIDSPAYLVPIALEEGITKKEKLKSPKELRETKTENEDMTEEVKEKIE